MKKKTYQLTIAKKIEECADACTLVLTPRPEDKAVFTYKPAQFLNFHLQIEDKEIIRSYSLSSSALLDEPLTTTIKKVRDGVASSYLIDNLKEGDVLESTRPLGRFFKIPKSLKPNHYFFIGAGSGITPLFSIIKTVLNWDEKNKVTLVYCNRNENSIIYREELVKYKEKYKDCLNIVHVLSRPSTSQYDYKGRLNKEVLNKILKDRSLPSSTEYYICGPIELMKMAENIFKDSGVDKTQIHKESFGSASKTANAVVSVPNSAIVISADEMSESAVPEIIVATMEGETIEVPVEQGLTILENLVEAGHCPPFSCMEGNCMTCLASLKRGKVYQDSPGILDEENIDNKEILTCQAKPVSSRVEIDYDS